MSYLFSFFSLFSKSEYPALKRKRNPRKFWKLKARVTRSFWNRQTRGLSLAFNLLAVFGVAAFMYMPHFVHDNYEMMARKTEIGCMAINMMNEGARKGTVFDNDEPEVGLIAIGIVVQNRLELGFHQAGMAAPKSACDVVWAGSQFSWTLLDEARIFNLRPQDEAFFNRAFTAATEVLLNTHKAQVVRSIIRDADHYYNPSAANPSWARNMKDYGFLGNHRFMADSKRYPRARQALLENHGLVLTDNDAVAFMASR